MVVACRRQKRPSRAIRVFCLLRPVANTACASTRFQRDRWPPVQQARLESSKRWSSTAPTTLPCQNRYRWRKLETQRRSSRVRSLLELPAPCFTSTRATMRWGWRFKKRRPKTDSRLRIFFGGCRCSFPLDPDFDFLKARLRHPTGPSKGRCRRWIIPADHVDCSCRFERGGGRGCGDGTGGRGDAGRTLSVGHSWSRRIDPRRRLSRQRSPCLRRNCCGSSTGHHSL